MNRSEKRRQKKLKGKPGKLKKPDKGALPTPSAPLSSNLQHAINLGLQYHNAGDLRKAEQVYQQILQTEPNQPIILYLSGVIAQQLGNHQTAFDLIKKSLLYKPDYAEAHNALGVVLKGLGKIQDAELRYRNALTFKPNYAEAHNNLGNALTDQGHPNDAVACYRKAITINPNYQEAIYNLGIALDALGLFRESVATYRKVIEINPGHAKAHNNLGIALYEISEFSDAIVSYQTAIKLKPDYAEAHDNLGNVYCAVVKFNKAIASYRRAIEINPGRADTHNNLGVVLNYLGNFGKAAAQFRKALEINPDYHQARLNLSHYQLLTGDFATGWENYRSRWEVKNSGCVSREFRFPMWNGSNLAGKHLLVWMEQGIGDEIMFATLFAELEVMCSALTVECEKRLLPLFRRSFKTINFITRQNPIHRDLQNAEFDFQISAGDLARHLRKDITSFPPGNKYLRADNSLTTLNRADFTKRWPGKLLVGISWKGGTKVTGAMRSLSLERLAPILSTFDCQFINLQYGEVNQEIDRFRQKSKNDIHDEPAIDPLNDMDTYAAHVAALDLVLSIDNSTVHLAGGLGVPTWVMLPVVPDWRWLQNRNDNPWYASIRLFRQNKTGDWDDVIEEVRAALAVKTLNK